MHGFSIYLGERPLVRESDFALEPGSSSVIIGPTGVGKSVLLKAVAGLLPARTFRFGGSMRVQGFDAYVNGRKTGHGRWSKIRSRGLVFVPAESGQAMNPALTLEQNLRLLAPDARPVIERRLADHFGLAFGSFARLYPDEVSGGELQRITLMILLSRRGDLVLLDEPTVSLDRNLRRRFIDFLNAEILPAPDKTVLMASHDLDFIQALKMDDAYGLEGARLQHLARVPRANGFQRAEARRSPAEGLSVRGLSQKYFKRGIFGERSFQAFSGLSIEFDRSTIYGITGPSGCGKSSLIKAILRLLDGTNGQILLDGEDLVRIKPRERGRDPLAFQAFPAQDGGRPAGLALRLLPGPPHPGLLPAHRRSPRRIRPLRSGGDAGAPGAGGPVERPSGRPPARSLLRGDEAHRHRPGAGRQARGPAP